MTKWEYLFIPVFYADMPTGEKGLLGTQKTRLTLVTQIGDQKYPIGDALKTLGEEGWELVTAGLYSLAGPFLNPPSRVDLAGSYVLYFKRPKSS